jgi:hypothetical protein
MFFGNPSLFSAPAPPISPGSFRFNICNFSLLRSSRRARLLAPTVTLELSTANRRLALKARRMNTCTNRVPNSPEINTCDLLNLNSRRMNSYEKIPGGEGILQRERHQQDEPRASKSLRWKYPLPAHRARTTPTFILRLPGGMLLEYAHREKATLPRRKSTILREKATHRMRFSRERKLSFRRTTTMRFSRETKSRR